MADTNSTSPTSETPAAGSRRRLLVIIAIAAVALYGVAVLAINSKLSSARQAHEGDHSLELGDYLPPPDLPHGAVNATDYLEAAGLISDGQAQVYQPRQGPPPEDLKTLHQNFRHFETERRRPSAEDYERFRAVVERYDLTLQVLDQGLAKATAARYMTDYEVRPYEVIIPNLLIRLRYGSLYRARAELAIRDGHYEDAWGDAGRIFQLAHWTTDDIPTLINTLVARAIAHQGALLTQTLLAKAPVSADVRGEVLKWAQAKDVTRAINRMLYAERSITYDFILNEDQPLSGLSEPRDFGPIQRLLAGWQPWRRVNAAVYLETATRNSAACSLASFQRTREQQLAADARPPSWAGLAQVNHFACSDVGTKRDLWLVDQHHIGIAMGLEKIRETTGQYPDQLTDSPLDPFSGEPYKYHREGDGYVLYSVSANAQDDGGSLAPANKEGFADYYEGDLVWQVSTSASNLP